MFFSTNVLLGMSTICRKHCHMGKGGKSHFKSNCTYLKKKEKNAYSRLAWLLSRTSRLLPEAWERCTVTGTWGACFCENSAEKPQGKGAEVVVKEKSCYFYIPMSIGRETEMGKCIYTTQLLVLLINPSEQLRVHGGLLVHPKASSL